MKLCLLAKYALLGMGKRSVKREPIVIPQRYNPIFHCVSTSKTFLHICIKRSTANFPIDAGSATDCLPEKEDFRLKWGCPPCLKFAMSASLRWAKHSILSIIISCKLHKLLGFFFHFPTNQNNYTKLSQILVLDIDKLNTNSKSINSLRHKKIFCS